MPKIQPQVGMPVLYHVHLGDHFPGSVCAGKIAAVFEDGTVNLSIFDARGLQWNLGSVLLWQGDDGEAAPAGGRWCEFPEWFVALTVPRKCACSCGRGTGSLLAPHPDGSPL